MNSLGTYERCAAAALREARRTTGGISPQVFALTYLPAHFSRAVAGFHENIFEDLGRIVRERGSRVAIAAPRGHAKSTVVTLAYALWCMLYEHERLVVIVSNTAEQASKLLGHVKHEIETNPLLREDFPELEGARRVSPWRKDSILLPNGSMALSYGAGQNLRGARHREHRPSLILADDLEDKESVLQEEQRQKTAGWFASTLLKAGNAQTNVVVVGTVLHHDSLLARLLDHRKSPGWRTTHLSAVRAFSDRADLWDRWAAVYRGDAEFAGRTGPAAARALFESDSAAMLRGTRVLWPAGYAYYELMETRLREGEHAFQAEMQNQPLDPDLCVFASAKLRFWDAEHADAERLVEALGPGRFFGACDPSLGADPSRGDYTAIVVLFKPYDGRAKYVIAADLARRRPGEAIERILRYARMYRFSQFGVEANQFQQLMVEDLERRAREEGLRLTVTPIKNRSGKQQRILGVEAEVSQGLIRFSRAHDLLLEQLRAFPLGKHDDGPDALEMAVHVSGDDPNGWSITTFDGEVLYDSERPRRPGRNGPMPDRL